MIAAASDLAISFWNVTEVLPRPAESVGVR
jgi:hypothetical protein